MLKTIIKTIKTYYLLKKLKEILNLIKEVSKLILKILMTLSLIVILTFILFWEKNIKTEIKYNIHKQVIEINFQTWDWLSK